MSSIKIPAGLIYSRNNMAIDYPTSNMIMKICDSDQPEQFFMETDQKTTTTRTTKHTRIQLILTHAYVYK